MLTHIEAAQKWASDFSKSAIQPLQAYSPVSTPLLATPSGVKREEGKGCREDSRAVHPGRTDVPIQDNVE